MTPPLGRRERNKAAKRARILAAARRRFTDQGYEATTMAQVAADADVAIGTVFAYAATKPELLMMVVADMWADLPQHHPRTPAAPPHDEITTLLDPLLQYALHHTELSMTIARELLFGAPGEHRAVVVQLISRLEAVVADILRDGGADARAEAAARLVVSGALLELNRTRTGRADARSTARRLHEHVDLAIRGAGAHVSDPPTLGPAETPADSDDTPADSGSAEASTSVA